MTNKSSRRAIGRQLAVLVVTTLAAVGARAELTPQELQRLGREVTPVGAQKEANADGSIPAWDGGLTKPPAGFDRSKGYANPYAGDKPLYIITAANAAQYQALLAPGQMELLKRYPDYKMKVYPSRRSAGYPSSYYDAIQRDAAKAKLIDGGLGVHNVNAVPTLPFPIPKNGTEVIQNHVMRYIADAVQTNMSVGAVQTNGSFTPVRWLYEINYTAKMPDAETNHGYYFKQQTLSPSNSAGEATIVIGAIDHTKFTQQAWTYNPGQRRVLRAPDVGYDTPFFNVDGLATIDDSAMFNGAMDRYEWKLLGKKEMLISYNNYELASKALKYTDVIKAGVPNQELPRYEKHRVWVVEATLKPGARHIYAKRVFYVDEDSWQIAHADKYDARGGLWRVHEGHAIQLYDVPSTWYALAIQHDLQARRYFFEFLQNEDKPPVFGNFKPRSYFTADSLRRSN